MKIRHTADIVRYRTMTNTELSDSFTIRDLFSRGFISSVYSDIDRGIIGSAVPDSSELLLETSDAIRSDFFAERREIGVINIGGSGQIKVDEKLFSLEKLDSLYIGRGSKHVTFRSSDPGQPAKFYFISYPAHKNYPTTLIEKKNVPRKEMGEQSTSNKRVIFQSIHPDRVATCQLLMGFTMLELGSVWNTFPPHTHLRRSEFYLYFDLAEDSRIFHFMGEQNFIKTLVLNNQDVALSPSWSMHCGVGTSAYSFIWAMGGENQDFDDMDFINPQELE
ncbi:MAG: 5-dehydro-4-deoxy-D-glucuronate isomerase [Cellvibrionales bacterium TMED49]|nr:MAG: 5-dehydro-4-deoxy-D-glucuronate isomerase [Cellvibrionales bacterium TMED49]OUU39963.1 MAG: 5-dehydro-4-deoxy-D-glucuronate isomerase [Cellvibrionales bacterium TMED49]|tara:strand:- start:113 stop:943 length:831 start_codon:yes stop_codon:yes gene_type:complete